MERTSVKLLIIEDQDETRKTLRNLAYELGLEIECHTRIGDAITSMSGYDIMVMDWHLPNGDPETLLDEWANRNKGPVAIIYSEMSDIVKIRLLSKLITWNLIAQPVRQEELEEVMRILLRRYIDYVMLSANMKYVSQRIRWLMWGLGFTLVTTLAVAIAMVLLIIH